MNRLSEETKIRVAWIAALPALLTAMGTAVGLYLSRGDQQQDSIEQTWRLEQAYTLLSKAVDANSKKLDKISALETKVAILEFQLGNGRPEALDSMELGGGTPAGRHFSNERSAEAVSLEPEPEKVLPRRLPRPSKQQIQRYEKGNLVDF